MNQQAKNVESSNDYSIGVLYDLVEIVISSEKTTLFGKIA